MKSYCQHTSSVARDCNLTFPTYKHNIACSQVLYKLTWKTSSLLEILSSNGSAPVYQIRRAEDNLQEWTRPHGQCAVLRPAWLACGNVPLEWSLTRTKPDFDLMRRVRLRFRVLVRLGLGLWQVLVGLGLDFHSSGISCLWPAWLAMWVRHHWHGMVKVGESTMPLLHTVIAEINSSMSDSLTG